MEGRESMGLMMPNIITADLMLRTVSILTQRGRNLMSIGAAIRVSVSDYVITNEEKFINRIYSSSRDKQKESIESL